MPSILDLAKSCEASYKSIPELAGWDRIQRYTGKPSGFFGALFRRQLDDGTAETILVFRGTDGFLDRDMVLERDPIYQEPIEWS